MELIINKENNQPNLTKILNKLTIIKRNKFLKAQELLTIIKNHSLNTHNQSSRYNNENKETNKLFQQHKSQHRQ